MGKNIFYYNVDSTANIYLYIYTWNELLLLLQSPNIMDDSRDRPDDSTSSGKRRSIQAFKTTTENTAVQKCDHERELKYNITIRVLCVHMIGDGVRRRSFPAVF